MIINHRWNLYSHLLGLITGTLYILVDCYAIICFILETRSQVMHLDKIIIFCFWMFLVFLVFFDSARKDKYLWDNFHFMCVCIVS